MPRALRPKTTRKTETPRTLSTTQEVSRTSHAAKKPSSDYVEIRLPKVRFQDSPLSPLWVILLVIFSFLLGMTTTKIQYMQSGQTSGEGTVQGAQAAETNKNGAPAQAITMDTVKAWAKDLKLDTKKFNQCVVDQPHQEAIDKDLADAVAASAEATPTFYVNGTRIVGAVPYEQFKTAIDAAIAGTDTGEKVNVEVGHLPMLGKDSATVTMVEFSDLQCPYCMRFHQDTFPQLKKDYIDTGKIKFYYRQLPLSSLHPMAMSFAHATECANDQGKFWDMHNKIFNEQAKQS